MATSTTKLRGIKLIHTVAWAFFASAILLIPVMSWIKAWTITGMLIGVVTVECVILALNEMRCPLTGWAARYTDDRADNFDIYLPLWIARYNKQIFGFLFLASIVFSLICWLA